MWALASEQAAVRRRVEAMERSLDRLGAHKEAAE
jgi:hypothetical protein